MPVLGDDMDEGSVSSLLVEAHNSNQIADALSAADESWVNSILINEFDIADTDWSSMQKDLLNILGSEAVSVNTSAIESNDISTSEDDPVFVHEEAENNEDGILKGNNDFPFKSANYLLKNIFKTGCKDAMLENLNNDFGLDLELLEYDAEVSVDEIFKVWNLEILQEKDEYEDKLIQQLKGPLEKSSVKMAPSTSVDYINSIEFKDDDLDELITGITDLCLTQKSN